MENAESAGRQSTPPKVFISYCWTSPGHQDRIRQWAERLLADGIDVIFDLFALKEGHDKYAFMEKMVTDPSVTHVLLFCDSRYAEKADARAGGVGTESQIVSREVYDKVDQSKFIPIACEFGQNGEPSLPVFLRSRIWIDFSSLEAANENWEKLVRALFGKPIHLKPQLGKPPAYITNLSAVPASPIIGKFSTFKQALLNDSKSLRIYRDDFLTACLEHADALRVRQQPDATSLADKIVEDCASVVSPKYVNKVGRVSRGWNRQ